MTKASWVAVCVGLLAMGCERTVEIHTPPLAPVGDMQHTMVWYLEPAADAIWDSAGWIVTAEGEEDLAPTSDEEWARVRHGAVVIAEGANLLMHPDLAVDQADWSEFTNAMSRVSLELIDIADQQDPDALFEKGGHLYNVCKACHQVYDREE